VPPERGDLTVDGWCMEPGFGERRLKRSAERTKALGILRACWQMSTARRHATLSFSSVAAFRGRHLRLRVDGRQSIAAVGQRAQHLHLDCSSFNQSDVLACILSEAGSPYNELRYRSIGFRILSSARTSMTSLRPAI
jgi:hypothetical protein